MSLRELLTRLVVQIIEEVPQSEVPDMHILNFLRPHKPFSLEMIKRDNPWLRGAIKKQ